MDFSRFDKYHRYLIIVPLLIALLTYWRFRQINLSDVYIYVAQQDVIHPALQQGLVGARSVVWNFFGLLNRMFAPNSIIILRIVGLALTVLNYFLLSKLLNDVLGQRFWGFLGAFLVSFSPFTIVAAVAGIPAASSLTIVILFLAALYRNQYVFAGILAGVTVAANLPGFIMFLITILDLLQNSAEKKRIIPKVLTSAAGFFGVVLLLFIYSMTTGGVVIPPVPFQEMDISWSWMAVGSILVVNIINVIGIVYLFAKKRYDIYQTHFHVFMSWITFCTLCFIQPATSNLLVALVVSTLLSVFFLQGFVSIWNISLLSAETFVFLFVVVFLFTDIYANDRYLHDEILTDSIEKSDEVEQVLASIIPFEGKDRIISNFAPSELSVKLMEPVVEVKGEPVPFNDVSLAGGKCIYVVDKTTREDSLYHGCKLLTSGDYEVNGVNHFVKVIQYEGEGK